MLKPRHRGPHHHGPRCLPLQRERISLCYRERGSLCNRERGSLSITQRDPLSVRLMISRSTVDREILPLLQGGSSGGRRALFPLCYKGREREQREKSLLQRERFPSVVRVDQVFPLSSSGGPSFSSLCYREKDRFVFRILMEFGNIIVAF